MSIEVGNYTDFNTVFFIMHVLYMLAKFYSILICVRKYRLSVLFPLGYSLNQENSNILSEKMPGHLRREIAFS